MKSDQRTTRSQRYPAVDRSGRAGSAPEPVEKAAPAKKSPAKKAATKKAPAKKAGAKKAG